jgi:hypothetical protein
MRHTLADANRGDVRMAIRQPDTIGDLNAMADKLAAELAWRDR